MPATNPVIISSKQLFPNYSSSMDSSNIGNYGVGSEINANPYLRIIEQPKSQMRFRYPTEKGSHGCLTGQTPKSYPTVKLENYKVTYPLYLRASLYTNNEEPMLHVHSFYGQNCDNGICTIGPLNAFEEIRFENMKITFCPKKNAEEMLMNRYKKIYMGSSQQALESRVKDDLQKLKDSNYSSAKILFEAYHRTKPNENNLICSTFSDPIFHQTDVTCSTLKISRLSKYSSRKNGQEEVILLCDKVDKNNIGIRFFELNENEQLVWEREAEFKKADVHHQYAITFKTPHYDGNITRDTPKTVKVQLFRPNDRTSSEPVDFEYIPDDDDEEGLATKRQKTSHNIEPPYACQYPMQSSSTASNFSSLEYNVQNYPMLTSQASTSSSEFQSLEGVMTTEDMLEIFSNDYPFDEQDGLKSESSDPTLGSVNSDIETQSLTPLTSLNPNYLTDSLSFDLHKEQNCLKTFKPFKLFSFGKNYYSIKKDKKQNNFTRDLQLLCGKLSRLQCDENKSFVDANNGNSVLHLAVIHKNKTESILPQLLRSVNYHAVNIKNYMKQTALHIATVLNSAVGIRFLLYYGADPMIIDKEGKTCVHLAAKHKTTDCLKLILQYLKNDTDLDYADYNGLTALHIAIQCQSEQCFQMLVDAGADIIMKDKITGKNCLHLAVLYFPQIVKELLSKSAFDIDAQDYEGNTALHLACMNQQYEIASLLMEAEANPSIKNFIPVDDEATNKSGQTAYDLADNDSKLHHILTGMYFSSEDKIQTISSCRQNLKLDLEYISKDEVCHKLVDDITLNKLEKLLNPPSTLWEVLANFTGIDTPRIQGVMKLKKENSHVKVILSLFEKAGQTTEELLTALEFAGLKEAYDIIKNYIN